MTHLNALISRLHNEQNREAFAQSEEERKIRKVYVAQIKKEIADEVEHLGKYQEAIIDLSDIDLLGELGITVE